MAQPSLKHSTRETFTAVQISLGLLSELLENLSPVYVRIYLECMTSVFNKPLKNNCKKKEKEAKNNVDKEKKMNKYVTVGIR